MTRRAEAPHRQVMLELPPAGGVHAKAPRSNLSAVALVGRSLFLGTDEGTVLDRLVGDATNGFAAPTHVRLENLLSLRGEDEIDIEGLDVEGNGLWLVGSHSRTRGKPGKTNPVKDLAELRHNPNRHVLARFEIAVGENGVAELPAPGAHLGRVRQLPLTSKRGTLTKAIRQDEHLAPFLKLPAKENGFDIEGIAARGHRLLLGLRGPVLRGFAVVLEIELAEGGAPDEYALQPIGREGRSWRKHFLDLGGNGIRDLHRDGEDLLILAGPTADLDGRCAIWRWRDAFGAVDDSFDAGDDGRLSRVLRVPVGDDADHPEGICLLPQSRELLVVYDSPAAARCRGEGGVMADIFELPRR